MPGKETELTARLKPSQRQFFQWHLIEKHSLRTVKDNMDKLTKALNAAGYSYNFVADVKSWKNRSRYWNSTAKKAWKVQPNHKGWDLFVPTELVDVPIWIQWGQNVGDWRSNKSEGKNQRVSTTTDFSSQALVSQANDHHDNHQDTGHWNTAQQISTLTEHLEALPNTNKPPYLPKSTTNHAGIVFSGPTTETIPLPQQSSNYLATVPFPSLPQPDQPCNALQGHAHRQNSYRQNYQIATPISNVNLPLSSPIHGNDHESVSYLSDTDPSHAHDESWP